MSALDELRDAISRITAVTGDPRAWTRGLTPDDIAAIGAAAVDPEAVAALSVKVRANHPAVFAADPGSSVLSPPPAPGQQGEAVSAIRKAEDDLAQQNSASAQLDLHVVAAILNAHADAGAGSESLRRLQEQIEEAVRMRTDLDTATGAREFQRFLIGKLREIAAVVESANLEDSSKAALATAWTALYRSDLGSAPDPTPDPERAEPAPAEATSPPSPEPMSERLPPYGSDIGDAALFEPLPAPVQTMPAAAAPGTAPAPAAAPPAPLPSVPTVPGTPPMPGPSALPTMLPDLSRLDQPPPRSSSEFDDPAELDVPPDPVSEDEPAAEDAPADRASGEDTGTGAESDTGDRTVRLPGGELVEAPSDALAEVFRSALRGTPVVEAFRAQGITVPPPGTAVPHPVEPPRVAGGDVGMFTDRQALALDRDRAWFGGRIQPVSAIGGPSFLGWLHPPSERVPNAPAPDPGDIPPPTRPADAGVGHDAR